MGWFGKLYLLVVIIIFLGGSAYGEGLGGSVDMKLAADAVLDSRLVDEAVDESGVLSDGKIRARWYRVSSELAGSSEFIENDSIIKRAGDGGTVELLVLISEFDVDENDFARIYLDRDCHGKLMSNAELKESSFNKTEQWQLFRNNKRSDNPYLASIVDECVEEINTVWTSGYSSLRLPECVRDDVESEMGSAWGEEGGSEPFTLLASPAKLILSVFMIFLIIRILRPVKVETGPCSKSLKRFCIIICVILGGYIGGYYTVDTTELWSDAAAGPTVIIDVFRGMVGVFAGILAGHGAAFVINNEYYRLVKGRKKRKED
jgi:hypothetical protein